MKKKLFFGVYNPSIILTYIGVFFAICGMCMVLNQNPANSMDIYAIAMLALSASGICDLFDGTIARACKRTDKEKEFGVQLDSLADVISFVAFPAVIMITMNNMSWHSTMIACFYVFAGIMRLGWFNIMTEENKGFYQGLPVTFASLLFPFIYAILNIFDLNVYSALIYEIALGVVGVLFISNFKLKKTGIKSCILWVVIAIVAIVGILFF